MQKNKDTNPPVQPDPDHERNDPFLKRIKVQRTIIKKMLAEIDLPRKTGETRQPEDNTDLPD